jgi:hypothetical protein
MAYEYLGEEDLYYVSSGTARIVKRGQRIRDNDEDYFLTRYPDRIKLIPGTEKKVLIDVSAPSNQELSGLRTVVEGQSKTIDRQSEQIDKLIEALTKVTELPPSVIQTFIPQPMKECSVSEINGVNDFSYNIEKPKIENAFIENVVKADGITAAGTAGDARGEGDKIDDKISKLRKFKKKS